MKGTRLTKIQKEENAQFSVETRDRAAQMVREVKAGNWQAYYQWLRDCQLENALAGD